MVRTIENTAGVISTKPDTRMLTLAEQIADRIAESIISGQFPPGDRLSEQELANLFGVSRGPIREALRILEREDLVRILPRRGTVVTELTPREVEDIFHVRACLTGLAARLTTQRLTPAIRRGLDWSLSQIERLSAEEDVDEFLRLAYRLSMYLADCSRNEKLQSTLLSMARQTLPLTRRALVNPGNRSVWARNWQDIATAILDGDADAAESAARTLVGDAGGWATAEARAAHDAAHLEASRASTD